MAIREQIPGNFDSTVETILVFELSSVESGAPSPTAVSARQKFSGEYQRIFAADLRRQLPRKLYYTASTPDNADECLRYGVTAFTTVCTALLVPFTVLCATFLAVIAVFFATCLAVRTGPAWTVPAQTANARMTENNAFIVQIFRG
jgi:hypothetical protein